MTDARRLAWALTGIAALGATPVLGACSMIAGYDGAQAWPLDAGVPVGPSTLSDAQTSGAQDGATEGDALASFDGSAGTTVDGGRDAPFDAATDGASRIDASPIADASNPSDVGVPVVDASPVIDASIDAGACPVLTGGTICSQVPRFTAARQVVDGVGDEFCDVPATFYTVESAAYKARANPGRLYTEEVTYRIAWSDVGIHVHVHVKDPKIIVATTDNLYDGDAVVLHFSGSSTLTGAFNGTTDGGAVQILVAPAFGAFPARAYAFYWEPGARKATVDPGAFASRLTSDGYEVEMRIPWSSARDPNSVKIGGAIGIDPGVIVKDDPATVGQDLEATLGLRPLPTGATTTCSAGIFAPWCDDRTWCVSTLK